MFTRSYLLSYMLLTKQTYPKQLNKFMPGWEVLMRDLIDLKIVEAVHYGTHGLQFRVTPWRF